MNSRGRPPCIACGPRPLFTTIVLAGLASLFPARCQGQVEMLPAAPEVAERLDALYRSRNAAASLAAMEAIAFAANVFYGSDYEVLWRVSRFRWWQADGATDDALKNERGKEAWDAGERALRMKPNGVEGHLYAAVGAAACAEVEYRGIGGVARAIADLVLGRGIVSSFNDHIDNAIRLDDGIELGAPRVAKGRYWYRLEKYREAAAEFDQCLARHPENLRARLYAAENLLAQGDARGARKAILQVLNGSTRYSEPEGERIRGWAKVTAQKIEEVLE